MQSSNNQQNQLTGNNNANNSNSNSNNNLGSYANYIEDVDSIYCICRTREVSRMICCDDCDHWFHQECIGMKFRKAEELPRYQCVGCERRFQKEGGEGI